MPRLLTLRLLRFDNSLRKIKSRISFPSELDLTAYCPPPLTEGHDAVTELELVAVTVNITSKWQVAIWLVSIHMRF